MVGSKMVERDQLVLECFRHLWNCTDDVMFVIAIGDDGEMRLCSCNAIAKKVMGLDDDVCSRSPELSEILGGRLVEPVNESYHKAVAARKPIVLERDLGCINGLPYVWHALLVPLFDDAGKPAYLCGVARNVTDLKDAEKSAALARQQADIYAKALSRINESLEARVLERTEELIRANSAKQRFLANVSHELRTPLTAIIGHTESLLLGEYTPEEVREAASYIHSNSRHLLDLMNDVLDISKIEAGKPEQHLEADCLADEEAETDLKAMFQSRLPDYIQSIQKGWDELNLGVLKSDVHQLKGAALLFDYPSIGAACRELEVRLQPGDDAMININAIKAPVEALLELLRE